MQPATFRRDRACSSPERWGSDRGDIASSILMLPLIMFAVLMVFQIGLIMHGRNVVRAAAQDALRAAQLETATSGNGHQAAQRTLRLAANQFDVVEVTVEKSDTEVIVKLTGEINAPLGNIFNGFDITVSGPTERFYNEDERQ